MKKGFLCKRYIAGLIVVFISISSFAQVRIVQTLTSIDGYNFVTDQLPVDNFELEFYGSTSSTDVQDIFMGPDKWGTPARICDYPGGTGVDVTWFDRVHPISHGNSAHFGVDYMQTIGQLSDPLPDIDVLAYWTRIEKEIIPFPNVSVSLWSVETEISIQFLFHESFYNVLSGYIDSVRYAYSDTPVTLKQLKWKSGLSVEPVTPTENKINYYPSISLPGITGPQYLILQFALTDSFNTNPPYAYVNYQFHIDTTASGSYIMKKFDINLDVLNKSGEAKDNFEFDWIGYTRIEDIKDYYKGNGAWGNPPRLQEFEYGSLPPLVTDPLMYVNPNILGGLEITWMDKCNPLFNDQWAHFGVSTGIGVQLGNISKDLFYFLLYWTKVVKVEDIPVPWQWWQVSYTNPIIRDIVQLGSKYSNPVYVKREYAVIPTPLPLDSLRFNPDISTNWQQVDASPVAVAPAGTLQVDIPVSGKMYGAALVRYNVFESADAQTPVAQIINQAEFFDPKPTSVHFNTHQIPEEFTFSQNYPNPFNMDTKIQIDLPRPDFVTLVIYNVRGQRIRTVYRDGMPAGTHTFSWDGENDAGQVVPSGIYFAQYQTKDVTKSIKMHLLK